MGRGLSLLLLGGLFGCTVAPPRAPTFERDLSAALSRAGPAGLVVAHFALPGRPGSDAMVRDVLSQDRVARAVAPDVGAIVDARQSARVLRDVFGTGPAVATGVVDGEGRWLAARLGTLDADEFVALVERARRGHADLVAACVAFQATTAGVPGAARAQAAARVAAAYRRSGNPIAAHRHYVLVTLIAPPVGGHRPGVATACQELARLEIERGSAREAREWLELLAEEDPGMRQVSQGHVRLTEGLIALAERRPEAAFALLQDTSGAPEAEAQRWSLAFGRACHETGRAARARQIFEAVARKSTDAALVREARAELRHLDDPDHGHSHEPLPQP